MYIENLSKILHANFVLNLAKNYTEVKYMNKFLYNSDFRLFIITFAERNKCIKSG